MYCHWIILSLIIITALFIQDNLTFCTIDNNHCVQTLNRNVLPIAITGQLFSIQTLREDTDNNYCKEGESGITRHSVICRFLPCRNKFSHSAFSTCSQKQLPPVVYLLLLCSRQLQSFFHSYILRLLLSVVTIFLSLDWRSDKQEF